VALPFKIGTVVSAARSRPLIHTQTHLKVQVRRLQSTIASALDAGRHPRNLRQMQYLNSASSSTHHQGTGVPFPRPGSQDRPGCRAGPVRPPPRLRPESRATPPPPLPVDTAKYRMTSMSISIVLCCRFTFAAPAPWKLCSTAAVPACITRMDVCRDANVCLAIRLPLLNTPDVHLRSGHRS